MRNLISAILLFAIVLIAPTLEGSIEKNISTGRVKYYNESKGFGYIIDNKTNDELFVYDEGIIDEINDNDDVTFTFRNTRKGYEAINVKLLRKK